MLTHNVHGAVEDSHKMQFESAQITHKPLEFTMNASVKHLPQYKVSVQVMQLGSAQAKHKPPKRETVWFWGTAF